MAAAHKRLQYLPREASDDQLIERIKHSRTILSALNDPCSEIMDNFDYFRSNLKNFTRPKLEVHSLLFTAVPSFSALVSHSSAPAVDSSTP